MQTEVSNLSQLAACNLQPATLAIIEVGEGALGAESQT